MDKWAQAAELKPFKKLKVESRKVVLEENRASFRFRAMAHYISVAKEI